MPELDTPITGETAVVTNSETSAAPQGTVVSEEGAAKPAADVVAREEYEAARREAEQQKMRANQLENAAREQELNRLKEQEDYKSLAEKLQAELEAKTAEEEAAKARTESEAFREQVLGEYPAAVQAAAKALIAKDPNNLSWKNADTWDAAKAQLTDQLDALASVIGVPAEQGAGTKPVIDANNPLTQQDVPISEMSLEDLRKILPNSNRTY